MKRTLKYWAIRLLGREFMAMNGRQKAVGLWWVLSFCGLGFCCDANPMWVVGLAVANFAASSFTMNRIKA